MAGPLALDSGRREGAGESGREGGRTTSPQATRDVKVKSTTARINTLMWACTLKRLCV